MLSRKKLPKRFDEQCAALSNLEERPVEIHFPNVIYLYINLQNAYIYVCFMCVYIYIQFLDSIAFLYENQLGAYDWVTYIIDGERVHYCAAEIGIKVEKPLLLFGPRIVIFLNFLIS